MKKINITKKSLAIIILFIMLFGVVQPVIAVSSSGTGKWVARSMGLTNFHNR